MTIPRPRNDFLLHRIQVKLSAFSGAQVSGNARRPGGAQPADTPPPQHGLDQTVTTPPSSFQAVAVLTQPASDTGTWVIVSGVIIIDGVSHPVAQADIGASTLSYTWESSSAGNPSEHTLSATAQISFHPKPAGQAGKPVPIDLLWAPPPPSAPYTGFYGDGRVADFVFANVRLKSLQFTGNLGITQNQTTSITPPEFTWDVNGNQTASNPAAYIQGSNVAFTLALADPAGVALTGTAKMGYTLKLQANPNANNAATGQPIPSLTLYDNTAASPVAPTAFTGSSASVTASTALSGYVAGYTTTSAPINIYVEFTHVTPAPTWCAVDTCSAFGTKIYALVATPTGPMATPWVPVLDYACQWATGATDAASATTALAKGLYDNGTYDVTVYYTDTPQDGEETFHLKNFLSNTAGGGNLTGDCRAFADFLCCLSNGIGAKPLQVQRSAKAADIRSNTDTNRPCHFFTKNFVDAPWGSSVAFSNSWDYHEWVCSDVVFDACIGTTPTPVINLTEPNYQSAVVDYTQSPHFFQAQSAFTPTIVN